MTKQDKAIGRVKLGVVLPTWPYNQYRKALIKQTFDSLIRTVKPKYEPYLYLMIRDADPNHYPISELSQIFDLTIKTNAPASGTEPTLVWGTQEIFDTTECTHAVWMGDDALFNTNWLVELQNLILRHPDALSYTLYHSARQEYHTDLALPDENGDVPVKSICGHCLTIEKNRWNSLGLLWNRPDRWVDRNGTFGTVDLWDAFTNPGERWATYKSYVEHTGAFGINCSPACNEVALHFQRD